MDILKEKPKKYVVEASLHNKGEKDAYAVNSFEVESTSPDDACGLAVLKIREYLNKNNEEGDFRLLSIREAPPPRSKTAKQFEPDPFGESHDEDCAGA